MYESVGKDFVQISANELERKLCLDGQPQVMQICSALKLGASEEQGEIQIGFPKKVWFKPHLSYIS